MQLSVLIETSWNVKFSTESFLDCVVSVLIETSWNVKACSPSNNLTAISINRNIVECKERSWICCMKRDRGINRNIVECKADCLRYLTSCLSVLIETSWNVKLD